ncbi:hypothetical protein [Sulfuricurvum sp.]|uniref:hypothetical protein n=1 Tax=Sulfuricurvum sp. TaxID=2025608 RepID=UPI002618204B|nr:hypothetical protein [Sulfuricurvum sp.]MDD3598167.1 hypothetical protein [Sulfuricurvum sp.]
MGKLKIRLTLWMNGTKFILIPLIAFGVLQYIDMGATVKGILFLELSPSGGSECQSSLAL